jgi:formylmethanofuran dehydrogenase subunit E
MNYANPESPEDTPTVELIECRMCHRLVPRDQTGAMSGRVLCLGCLGSWYDDDDEDGDG